MSYVDLNVKDGKVVATHTSDDKEIIELRKRIEELQAENKRLLADNMRIMDENLRLLDPWAKWQIKAERLMEKE